MRRRAGYLGIAAASVALALASAVPASGAQKFEFTDAWGGTGTHAGEHGENLCRKLNIKPGTYAHVRVLLDSHFGRVQVAAPGDLNTFTEDGTLHCAPLLHVNRESAAPPPGHDSVRITCGSDEKAVSSGAGYYSTGKVVHFLGHGGFGPDLDGYVGYRWSNFSEHSAEVQFWGVCRRPG